MTQSERVAHRSAESSQEIADELASTYAIPSSERRTSENLARATRAANNRYYLAAHRRVVSVLTSNSAFLIFAVLVVFSYCRPYKML